MSMFYALLIWDFWVFTLRRDTNRARLLLQVVLTAADAGAKDQDSQIRAGFTTISDLVAISHTDWQCPNPTVKSFIVLHCQRWFGKWAAKQLLSAINMVLGGWKEHQIGIGEQHAVEEVAAVLSSRLSCWDGYRPTKPLILLNCVSFLRYSMPKNSIVVGGERSSLTSGIHQDGVLMVPLTYVKSLPWFIVKSNSLPLGKLSGRHAFRSKTKELVWTLQNLKCTISTSFKVLADKKMEVTDADIQFGLLERRLKTRRIQIWWSANNQWWLKTITADAVG